MTMTMTKTEAILHYGMMRGTRPSSDTLRDLFFSACLDAEETDPGGSSSFCRALHNAYYEARCLEAYEADDEFVQDLLSAKEAEVAYTKAFASVYCPGEERPDGVGSWDILPYESGQYWNAELIRDLGCLMAHFQKARDRAWAKHWRARDAAKAASDAE